ncbi:MAG: GAF domain-containing protein [Bacteroidales bacterium]|nr:GAF domain-containing protein [Bacteroidales bacterium]
MSENKNEKLKDFIIGLSIRYKLLITINSLLLLSLLIFGSIMKSYQKKSLQERSAEYMYGNLSKIEELLIALNLNQSGEKLTILNTIAVELSNVQVKKVIDSALFTVPSHQIISDIDENLGYALDDIFYRELKRIFEGIHYYNNGYPFLVSKSGSLIVHPSKEGASMADKTFFNRMVSSEKKEGHIDYTWPETRTGDKMVLYYKYFAPLDLYICATFYEKELYRELSPFSALITKSIVAILLLFSIVMYISLNPIVMGLGKVVERIDEMALGKSFRELVYEAKDEIGQIINAIKKLSASLHKTSMFAKEIGEGNLNADFTPLGKEDVLGNSLLDMRESLKISREEEQKRKVEDEKRDWANQGIARFNEILRKQSNLKGLGDELVVNLTEYLNANVCGIFLVEGEGENKKINLLSTYAYDRVKHLKRIYAEGEGLIGACVKEKKTVYLRNVPQNYLEVTSGLGKTNPSEILIVPLKDEDKIFGVLEIASLNPFAQHQVTFVESIGSTIASTIATARINEQTQQLLEQSKQQSDELASREEELRQNMEEMTATQEESQRKENELLRKLDDLQQEVDRLRGEKGE